MLLLTGGGNEINLTTKEASINPMSRPSIIIASGTTNGRY
jgi:hypothetical protein